MDKAAPLSMPRLAVDIKVLKDEQQLLYSRADMKEQQVGKVSGWKSTPDTGAQVVFIRGSSAVKIEYCLETTYTRRWRLPTAMGFISWGQSS